MKKRLYKAIFIIMSMFVATNIYAESLTVKMYQVAKKGRGAYIGTITATDTPYGVLLTPHLMDLKPGLHGFHLHQFARCGDLGKAAGGHFDPKKTGRHLGPYDQQGHLGDLPALYVNKVGDAVLPILAPRLKVKTLIDHALMIHAGGDNYSDQPKPLGGGGVRVACGVVQ